MKYAPCVSPSVAADVLSVVTEFLDCPELDSLVLGVGVGSMVTATCIGLAAEGWASGGPFTAGRFVLPAPGSCESEVSDISPFALTTCDTSPLTPGGNGSIVITFCWDFEALPLVSV